MEEEGITWNARREFGMTEYSEYSIQWRNIIFLPFNVNWQFLIVLFIVLDSMLILYGFVYNPFTGFADYIHYVIEILYLVDTVLSIAHRNMPFYNRMREYKPKHMLLQTIDVLTLLPYYEIYYMIKSSSGMQMVTGKVREVFRLSDLIRLYRAYDLFYKINATAASNHALIVSLAQLLHFLAFTHVVSALWYYMRCWKCLELNWTNILQENMIFDDKSPANWFIICFVTIGSTLANNWRGQIRGETPVEKFIIIVTMLYGFFLHIMIYFGKLTGVFMKRFRSHFLFTQNLSDIDHRMNYLQVDEKLKQKTNDYYNTYWKKRSGLKRMPKMYDLLPVSLQKDINLDIFWEALRHSRIFGQQDLAFKRALSIEMRNEFYLPGEYVFKPNEIKSRMIYVVSGIVQVITTEDEESPIISFSSGTVLGETSCLLPTKSITYVQCATYCEIQSLSIHGLQRALKHYKQKSRSLHIRLKIRLKSARKVHAAKMKQLKKQRSDIRYLGLTEDTSVKWIKTQWKLLSSIKYASGKRRDVKLRASTSDHTSRYLNLLVLSEEVELKIKVICLRGTCPFVLEPTSSFRWCTRYLILMAVIMQSVLLPYKIAFAKSITADLLVVFLFVDVIYILDIYLKLSTAINTKDMLVSESVEIVFLRFKDIYFLLDIVAILPFDYIALSMNTSGHVVALMKLNRLIKIIEVFHYLSHTESNIWMSAMTARLLKCIFIIAFSAYWLACLLFAITCFRTECNPNGWYLKRELNNVEVSNRMQLLKSIIYSISAFLGIRLTNSFEYILLELTVSHVVVLLGYFFFSYCYAQICATFVLRLERWQHYRDLMAKMILFLKRNSLPTDLRTKVMRALEFNWYFNKNVKIMGEGGILQDASEELKQKLNAERIKTVLKNEPIFATADEKILNLLTKKAELRTVPPNSILLTATVKSSSLYLISRGYCTSKSCLPGDSDRKRVTILQPGDTFPVAEIFTQVTSLIHVESITAVEFVRLTFLDIVDIVINNPIVGKEITKVVEEHFKEFQPQLLRRKTRLPEMIPPEHSMGKGDIFTYEIYDDYEYNMEEIIYLQPFLALGKWRILRYFLMRNTIFPHSKFYVTWEIVKSFAAIARLTMAVTYFTLLAGYKHEIDTIIRIIDVICVIDFYIRAHCQYYNEIGILVTHPWYTAKHYVQTSFAVDVFSMFPFRLLSMDEIFGAYRREMVFNIQTLFSRPFQMHRVISGLNYLQSDISRSATLYQTIKYITIVMIALAMSTMVMQLVACETHFSKDNNAPVIVCQQASWITMTFYKGEFKPISVFVQCLHLVLTFLTSSTCGSIVLTRTKDAVTSLAFYFLLYLTRWVVMAKIISHTIGGNADLEIFHERVESFNNFMKDEVADENLIKDVLSHYEYFSKKVQHDTNILNTLHERLHMILHRSVNHVLYGSTIEAGDAFQGADVSFVRRLGTQLTMRHYKKDSEIIRCNDVQGLIYIVHRGKVDISLAGSKLTTLGNGGIFGCLVHQECTRQTIKAVAKVHTELLTIGSHDFHRLVAQNKMVSQHMQQIMFLHNEYVDTKRRVFFDIRDSGSSLKSKRSSSSIIKTSLLKLIVKLNFVGRHDSFWYKIWEYILYVHLASLSSIAFMFYIFMLKTSKFEGYWKFAIYFLDVIYVIGVGMEFHLDYIEPESGLRISDIKIIQMKCLKSWKMWRRVFTCLPIEVVTMFITPNVQIIKYTMSNRILRMLYLKDYYFSCKESFRVALHLRWTYLIYWCSICIQIMTCMWWLSACIEGFCYYNEGWFIRTNSKTLKAKPGADSLLLAYTYVVNLFTSTGLRDVGPTTLTQLLMSIIIMGASQCLIVTVSNEFSTLLAVGRHGMNDFEFKLEQLHTYLQGRKLSPSIIEEVWKYCLKFWHIQQGEWMPLILKESPDYLKQDLMSVLYGHHLRNHFLFTGTHVDFLRQLIVHLHRCVYFPGNYLVKIGDVDESMYFIHKGEIEVYETHNDKEVFVSVLKPAESFGEAQGLYSVPHKSSYKARTVVDVVILKRADWAYLLEWFPASLQEIQRKSDIHHLRQTQERKWDMRMKF